MAMKFTVPLLINGEHRQTEDTFQVVSPATGEHLYDCASASIGDAEAAVTAATEAFTTWRRTTASTRRNILLKAADLMSNRRRELIDIMIAETGATVAWGEFNVTKAIEFLRDVAGRAASLEGRFVSTEDPDTSAIIMKEPYGVVLSIAPWNGPYILGVRCIAYPLVAGNTVVMKASELSPRTLGTIATVLEEAGLPRGVLNVITHSPQSAASITAALISDHRVRKVNFTGSTSTGRIVGRLAGEHLKPVVLELGGKAPAIVWEDANLEVAAMQCALGAFLNSGQICMSTEKIIVHKSIKAEFQHKLVAATEALLPSNQQSPVLINSLAVSKNRRLMRDAVSRGASVIYGDIDAQEKSEAGLRPIILDHVTKGMEIYQTESFGPTVSLIEVESEEDAIRIANDTEYGLSSAVFTDDLRRGLRFARGIESGAVHINSMTVHDEPQLPHGGAKASGHGRFNTDAGVDEWVWTKNVTYKN